VNDLCAESYEISLDRSRNGSSAFLEDDRVPAASSDVSSGERGYELSSCSFDARDGFD